VLTVTDNAATAIRDITGHQDVPPGAGVRIAGDPSAGSLTLRLAAEPAQGDQVVDASGARVFLDSEAAAMLDDKALDAAGDGQGGVQFTLAEQAG
jgi:Fe-S cluster assembly iron-binding protein IscA